MKRKLLLLPLLMLVIPIINADFICTGESKDISTAITSTEGGYYAISIDGPRWITTDTAEATLAPGNTKIINIKATPPNHETGLFTFSLIAKSAAEKIKIPLELDVKGCYNFDVIAQNSIEFCGNDQASMPIIIQNNAKVTDTYKISADLPIWAVFDTTKLAIAPNNRATATLWMWPAYDIKGTFPIDIKVKSASGETTKTIQITANVKQCYDPKLFEGEKLNISAFTSLFADITLLPNTTTFTQPTNTSSIDIVLPNLRDYWIYGLVGLLATVLIVLAIKFKLFNKFGEWIDETPDTNPHYKFKDIPAPKPKYDIESPEPTNIKHSDGQKIDKLRAYTTKALDEGFTKKDIKKHLKSEGWDKKTVREAIKTKDSFFKKLNSWLDEEDEPIRSDTTKPKTKLAKDPVIKERRASLLSKFKGWIEEDDEAEAEKPKEVAKAAEPKENMLNKFKSWLEEDNNTKTASRKPKKKKAKSSKMKTNDKASMLSKMKEWLEED